MTTVLARDHAEGLERAFETPRERSYRLESIVGELPAFLRGTYYVNGPARFSRGSIAYRHWLDGDGMVAALAFDGDGAELTARFVRSTKWVEEEAAGRALFRTFGTAFEGDRLLRGFALASPVNVSVYPFAGRLLAFGEQGLPWELDPRTLETRGEFNFGGRLNPVSPFSAHPAFDPATGEMLNFGVSFASRRPSLTLYRFDAAGELLLRRRQELEAPCSMHDFGLSRRFAVFYVAPYLVDVGALLEGGRPLTDCLSWEPERGSRLLILERQTGEVAAEVPIGEGYCLHFVGCFEEGDHLVVDVVELEEPVYPDYQPLAEIFREVRPGGPRRRVVDVAAGRLIEERPIPFDLACDFPSMAPHATGGPYDDFWMLAISRTGRPGRKFLDRLVHVRWSQGAVTDIYQAPPGCFLGGEPIFVADRRERGAEEAAGAVICQQFDATRGRFSFLVFDAREVAAGPVAQLPLREPLHLGFHACFLPASGPGETEVPLGVSNGRPPREG